MPTKKAKREPRPLWYAVYDTYGLCEIAGKTKREAEKEAKKLDKLFINYAPHHIAKVVPCD